MKAATVVGVSEESEKTFYYTCYFNRSGKGVCFIRVF